MKSKEYIRLLFLVFFLIGCSDPAEDQFKSFDLPLIRESLKLEYSGKLRNYTELQRKYLKQAERENYKGGIATCYINLGRINLYNDTKEYLFLLKKAESELEDTRNPAQKGRLFTEYSLYYNYLSMHTYAIYYNNKGIKELTKINDPLIKRYLLADAFRAKGEIYKNLLKLDSAYTYFQRSRILKKRVLTDVLLAEYHVNNNTLDSAKFYLGSVLDLSRNRYLPYEVACIYKVSGDYEMRLNRYNEAERAYLNALKAYKQAKMFDNTRSRLYILLADLYQKKGDWNKAEYFRDKYHLEHESINNNMQANYPQARNKFIEDIKQDNETEKFKILVFIAFLILFLIIEGGYIYTVIKKVHHQKYLLQNETSNLQKEFYNKKYNEVIALARKNDSSFLMRFKEIYPEFIEKLQKINPELENSELTFCAYIKLNFATKEIASYTFVQPGSVQQRKRRLRKRLHLSSDVDLYKFFNEL